eukprot:CAMPEP_0204900904 /NCGR_PEP_ID=MMETSP1397-20131031/2751_1 /ASSEMBLY_ACC=CAM_ASM_000891 /TAXON_ID=49980 /ORGANISM="Climacostomum Climacostomum virens, Strain Stock W-24" /LENGTH=273 /DNA_ID=CAMNT_0052069143 /DNA_START=683 /DNA_END=1504 /DNA_ORIENTATION=+
MRASNKAKGNTSEDAFFLSEEMKVCGVADGVGSWGSYGVDPSLFSNELVRNCQVIAQKCHSHKLPLTTEVLREVGHEAHNKTAAYGSSTLVLASIVNSKLHYLSVGDSRIAVFRKFGEVYKVLFMSKDQQHAFNCPFQLSKLPSSSEYRRLRQLGYEKLVKYMEKNPGSISDTTSKGMSGTMPLQKSDIVLIGSDGLFDNLFREAIVETINGVAATQPEDLAKSVADELVSRAYKASQDPLCESPFERASKKHGRQYSGGKPDDITVVVLLNC